MSKDTIISAKQQKNKEILETGLMVADKFISKNYLIDLDDNPVLSIDKENCSDTNMRLYHIDRFVYDKKENVNDKMISVYSALHERNSSAILLICGDEKGIDYYLGVYSRKEVALCGDILNNGIKGNFPGSEIKLQRGNISTAILNKALGYDDEKGRHVSAVSIIPSMRDQDKDKYVQGIEKFVDTMQGKNYTAIFIAKPLSKLDLEYRKRGLEELASSLSPFVKTTFAYGENNSLAITDGMCENFSHSINQSISNTTGYNESYNDTLTSGTNSGVSALVVNSGRSKSRSSGYSVGNSFSEAITEGSTDTAGVSRNISASNTSGDSKTMTIEYINKSVEGLIKKLDEQLERIKMCESFGLWDCAAYFVSSEIDVSVMAANTYKALIAGDESSVENSYINTWRSENDNVHHVLDALRYGMHPQVLIPKVDKINLGNQLVTPGGFISGKELPLFMGIPQKSISGLTVNTIAEFGRNVFFLSDSVEKGNLSLGNIFHMGKQENTDVCLDINSLTSHCFITGSTGSGKSNTSYVLLNEFIDRKIPFLVIEPAKGEYKSEFANLSGINVFTTNPRYGQLLRLNPFWFDHENIHVLEHLDRLIEIFNACWEMYAAMPAILKAAAEEIYIEKGWDVDNSEYLGAGKPKFPDFNDLLKVLPRIIKSSEYSADTQGDYIGALVTRVASLAKGISGQIFCSSHAIPENTLFDENTIVDLSRVGSTETKALIMGILVLKLTEYRMAQATGSNSKLRHVTILEEAHNLLKRTSTTQGQETANLLGKSVEMISNSIAEMRTYGEGFIIIDQSPTAVDISTIKNTNTKIVMRLPEKSDCEAVGNAMALEEEQVKELAKLPTGVAAVIQNNWLETVLVKVQRATSEYHKEIKPVSMQSIKQLRAVVVSKILRQYFIEKRFDLPSVINAINTVDISDDKKKEAIENVKLLIDEVGSNRNYRTVVSWLMSYSCCQSAFDINEHILRLVDFEEKTAKDYQQLRIWKENLKISILNIVGIEEFLADILVENLIYAQHLKNEASNYFLIYEMLYAEQEMFEVKDTGKNITDIEKIEGQTIL